MYLYLCAAACRCGCQGVWPYTTRWLATACCIRPRCTRHYLHAPTLASLLASSSFSSTASSSSSLSFSCISVSLSGDSLVRTENVGLGCYELAAHQLPSIAGSASAWLLSYHSSLASSSTSHASSPHLPPRNNMSRLVDSEC